MHHFDYHAGWLHAEDVPLTRIAEEVGTPAYVYSSQTLTRHYRVFTEAMAGLDALVCFAVKANSNLAVLATLGGLGAGADVVSGGELARARAAGIPGDRIVFSGVGKTEAEMAAALDERILQFNVESEPELELLARIAKAKGTTARIALRINPDVDAGTHEKISTGKAENKFGIPLDDAVRLYGKAQALDGLEPVAVAMHIGSQITALDPFEAAFHSLKDLVTALRTRGHRIIRADLGGGLGIPYDHGKPSPPPLPADYAAVVRKVFDGTDLKLVFEPGRMIAGNAGILLAKVLYVKNSAERRFVIVDAAMNDLVRPTLYGAWHDIQTVRETGADTPIMPADVVGPVCESGDIFAKDRPLPPVDQGDLIAFMSAGAYGAVQASTYNTRPLVPEVLVHGSEAAVVRARPAISDLLALDRLPAWLKNAAIK